MPPTRYASCNRVPSGMSTVSKTVGETRLIQEHKIMLYGVLVMTAFCVLMGIALTM